MTVVDTARKTNGAPIKALLTITALWILGRVVWEVSISNEEPLSAQAAAGDAWIPQDQIDRFARGGRSAPATRGIGALALASQRADRAVQRWVAVTAHGPYDAIWKTKKTNEIRPSGFQPKSGIGTGPKPLKSHAKDSPGKMRPIVEEAVPSTINTVEQENRLLPFSVYAWLFWRQDSNGVRVQQNVAPRQAPGAQYGGSQAGAILSYRVLGKSDQNISLFARASSALEISGDEEFAVGGRFKPVSRLPIAFYAEQRFDSKLKGNQTAIYVAGGTGPDKIAADLELETYGQAGYVFGEAETGFFDLSATLQKAMLSQDTKNVSAGGGIWAGGQEGIKRIDVGPRVNIDMPIGSSRARLSIDYRQRIAGSALPGSAATVTLSTGF